jgi:hypothetical protein
VRNLRTFLLVIIVIITTNELGHEREQVLAERCARARALRRKIVRSKNRRSSTAVLRPPVIPVMSSFNAAPLPTGCHAIFCSGARSPCILDAMARYRRGLCGHAPPVLFCNEDKDDTRNDGSQASGAHPPPAAFISVRLPVSGEALVSCLQRVDDYPTIKLILVDDDPDSSVTLMSVLLALYSLNSSRRLAVLVISRQADCAGILPSRRVMDQVMSACVRVRTAQGGPGSASGFEFFVTNTRPPGDFRPSSAATCRVHWCDAVCDCKCRDEGDVCHYYACATGEQNALERYIVTFTLCQPDNYFAFRTAHRLFPHRCRTSGPVADQPDRVTSALAVTAPSDGSGAAAMRLGLFRLGYSPNETARALMQADHVHCSAVQLMAANRVCDTMLRACFVRSQQQSSPSARAECADDGHVEQVAAVRAGEHMDYFSSCHTVFCCGSRARPVADVMRWHAVPLNPSNWDDLPPRVLMYDGNPPQLLLPAARPMTRFTWNGGDGRPPLPVLGVALSYPDSDTLYHFMGVTNLIVAADDANSSAPALFHTMFCLWKYHRERRLTVRVVRSRTATAAAAALKTAVRAHTSAPNYGMSLAWLPRAIRSHHEMLKEFFGYMDGNRVTWLDETMDADPEERPPASHARDADEDAAARITRLFQSELQQTLADCESLCATYRLGLAVMAALDPVCDAFARRIRRALRGGDADSEDSLPGAPAPSGDAGNVYAMGFDPEDVGRALAQTEGDPQRAVNLILDGLAGPSAFGARKRARGGARAADDSIA